MARIIVTIDPEGRATVKAEGYRGKSCQDATKAIRAALGQETSEKKTPDYYLSETAGNRQTAGN